MRRYRTVVGLITMVVVLAVATPRAAAQGAPQEGIKVHGHWVIEVRNPDGTLASRSEFKNSLQAGGNVALARVLLGPDQFVRNWRLVIVSSTAPLCPSHTQNTFFQGSCEIVPPSFPDNTSGFFKNLTTVLVHNDGAIELKGSFTAEAAATIDVVHSHVDMGFAGSPNFLDSRVFTSKTLAPADQRQVAAGQIVQVTVTFSFS